MTMSDKAAQKKIIIIDKLELPAIKTNSLLKILNKLKLKQKILLVLSKVDQNIIKSARNIPSVTTIQANSLNTVDILKHEFLLITKDSLEIIKKTYLS